MGNGELCSTSAEVLFRGLSEEQKDLEDYLKIIWTLEFKAQMENPLAKKYFAELIPMAASLSHIDNAPLVIAVAISQYIVNQNSFESLPESSLTNLVKNL